MKKTISLICVILLLVTLVSMSSCSWQRYDDEWIIGKTSDEIQERYGKFDCVTDNADEDGLFCNCRCGYLIKESHWRWPGDFIPDEYYMISFDGSGRAFKVVESYYFPGG